MLDDLHFAQIEFFIANIRFRQNSTTSTEFRFVIDR